MTVKKFSDYDSMFREAGIDYPVAAGSAGKGVQGAIFTMVTGGVFVFASNGCVDMADTDYQVIVMNQTDLADPATVGSKTTSQFTITGPDNDDVLDIVIVGKLAGQRV